MKDYAEEMLHKIEEAFDLCPILRKTGYNFNELLFAVQIAELEPSPMFNITSPREGSFSFGWVDSFWTTKVRSRKVRQFGVWYDEEYNSLQIEVILY